MKSDPLARIQSHKGYQRLQDAETHQQSQELVRVRLGAPAGRAPPVLVKQLGLPELQQRSEVRRLQPLVSPRPIESKTPRLKIDLSRVHAILPGASLSTESARRSGPQISLLPPALQTPLHPSDSFLYALPDSTDLQSFNPFLRPKARTHFLPADLFQLDETDYSKFKYPLEAKARWWLLDGKYTWKQCKVGKYVEETGLFEVEYVGLGISKLVSRFNLLFAGEKEEEYLRKLAEASQRRDLLEASLRFEARVTASTARFPEIRMPSAAENRILHLLSRVILSESDRSRVIDEMHVIHRRNIVNFVFEIEHFASKSLLVVR